MKAAADDDTECQKHLKALTAKNEHLLHDITLEAQNGTNKTNSTHGKHKHKKEGIPETTNSLILVLILGLLLGVPLIGVTFIYCNSKRKNTNDEIKNRYSNHTDANYIQKSANIANKNEKERHLRTDNINDINNDINNEINSDFNNDINNTNDLNIEKQEQNSVTNQSENESLASYFKAPHYSEKQ